MKDSINVKWTGGMAFEAELNEHKVLLDAGPEVGGNNAGPRPKPMLMVSLAGCTGMDVISILKKMKVEVSDFNVKVDATLTDEHPKYFTSIHMIYEFWGKELPEDKIRRAIELSQEKYCGVSATLKKTVQLSYEIKLNVI
ncbi:MAG: OsmC family protein [Bacteroidales bacterium]|nr:OsmC family protein [Bacteroidales bacterium]